jgi:hypothetical protein
MTVLFYSAAILLVIALLAVVFTRADAARIAGALRIVGPVLMTIGGVVLLFAGRAGAGGMLISGALAWYLSRRVASRAIPTPGRRSSVRTAALEMELDHDSGGLSGIVLAGRFEGRELAHLGLEELLVLRADLQADPESVQLLETYLDGRFPVWREDAKVDDGAGQAAPAAAGRMSQQEAYQVLGLEAGASAADIRKAHRRLMQRLHPDVGGSSFLAARINEAKDVLLSGHG